MYIQKVNNNNKTRTTTISLSFVLSSFPFCHVPVNRIEGVTKFAVRMKICVWKSHFVVVVSSKYKQRQKERTKDEDEDEDKTEKDGFNVVIRLCCFCS